MILNLVIRLMSLVAYIFLLNYFFSGWSLERKYFAKLNFLILVIICLYIGSLCLFNFTSFPFLNILMSIVFILIIAKQYNLNKKELFFWIPILLATNFICELISLTLFKILFSSNSYDLNSPLFIIITTVFTMVVDVFILFSIKHLFLKKNTLYQPIDLVPLVALSSIPIVSVIILLSFLLSEIKTDVNSIALGLSVSFGILYINLCILYLYNHLIKRLRKVNHISLQNKALESEVKYIGEIKKNQLNISYIKHDLKNQYLVLLGLLNHEHTNEAKNYILNSMNQLDHQSNFYTGDSVLNYLLNEKNSIAKKEKIDFKTTIFLSKKSSLDNDVLAIIIGNLVDNALEACIRLPKEKNKNIDLVVKQINTDLLIDLSNSFNPSEINSRKKRQFEGMGIKSIHSLVKKSDGLYKNWIENDTYFVSIVLFNIY